jgi:hypothetical protein
MFHPWFIKKTSDDIQVEFKSPLKIWFSGNCRLISFELNEKPTYTFAEIIDYAYEFTCKTMVQYVNSCGDHEILVKDKFYSNYHPLLMNHLIGIVSVKGIYSDLDDYRIVFNDLPHPATYR